MTVTQVQPSGKGPEMYFGPRWRRSHAKEVIFYSYIYFIYPYAKHRFLDQRQTEYLLMEYVGTSLPCPMSPWGWHDKGSHRPNVWNGEGVYSPAESPWNYGSWGSQRRNCPAVFPVFPREGQKPLLCKVNTPLRRDWKVLQPFRMWTNGSRGDDSAKLCGWPITFNFQVSVALHSSFNPEYPESPECVKTQKYSHCFLTQGAQQKSPRGP